MKPARHDPQLALRTLDRHGVAFVLIGGLVGRAAGSPTVTNDTDVCYARDRRNWSAWPLRSSRCRPACAQASVSMTMGLR